jgi:hypothetical protein
VEPGFAPDVCLGVAVADGVAPGVAPGADLVVKLKLTSPERESPLLLFTPEVTRTVYFVAYWSCEEGISVARLRIVVFVESSIILTVIPTDAPL